MGEPIDEFFVAKARRPASEVFATEKPFVTLDSLAEFPVPVKPTEVSEAEAEEALKKKYVSFTEGLEREILYINFQ